MSVDVRTVPYGDGCEWNPGENRGAWTWDDHTMTVPATVVVGANGDYRLCATCAALPKFKRFRSRREIKRGQP